MVESTYNWYWLVDGVMAADYRVHLANPAAMQQYSGLKYTDDYADARWLAHLLRLGVLPAGYIDPKAARALRDVLRKRSHLVRQQTANVLSLQNILVRNTRIRLSAKRIHTLPWRRSSACCRSLIKCWPSPAVWPLCTAWGNRSKPWKRRSVSVCSTRLPTSSS